MIDIFGVFQCSASVIDVLFHKKYLGYDRLNRRKKSYFVILEQSMHIFILN